MVARIVLLFVLCSRSLLGVLEVLPSEYLVSYGSQKAPYQVVEFFSLSCPHCVDSYEIHFGAIRKELIDTGLVQWIFHPVPLEEVTARCFSSIKQLDGDKKRCFFELMMESAGKSGYEELLLLVKGVAERQGSEMRDEDELVFFNFLSCSGIDSSPLIAVNGVLRPDLQPTLEEIKKEVARHAQ